MNTVCVVGSGYVGLVTGACLAELGNRVVAVDVDAERIELLRRGEVPFFEPGLEELVRRMSASGRLTFTTSYATGAAKADVIFLCLPTPPLPNGAADTSILRTAVEELAPLLQAPYPVVVCKSTVPVGTCATLHRLLEQISPLLGAVPVVANPEFLREGSAIADFMHPDRVVIGSHAPDCAALVEALCKPLNAPILTTGLKTAEMIKYASNAFLATRISFINEIANICEHVGVDVAGVADGMGSDKRIGPSFLRPGVGYGGSCFPKDVQALAHLGAIHGVQPRLLRSVMEVNADQSKRVLHKLRTQLGRLDGATVAVWGIAYKPNTDDIREAPAVEIMRLVEQEGGTVRAYDPVAMPKAAALLPTVTMCADPYAAAAGADAVLLLTEWNEFKGVDLTRLATLMRRSILIDGRNAVDPGRAAAAGFHYAGIGRGSVPEPPALSPVEPNGRVDAIAAVPVPV